MPAPLIYRRTVDVNPLVTLLAILFLAELMGIAGVILAVPVAAAAQIVMREVLVLRRTVARARSLAVRRAGHFRGKSGSVPARTWRRRICAQMGRHAPGPLVALRVRRSMSVRFAILSNRHTTVSDSRRRRGMRRAFKWSIALAGAVSALIALAAASAYGASRSSADDAAGRGATGFHAEVERSSRQMFTDGRKIFRLDTFGSEAFWGDALQLHKAIAGEKNGGVGPGVSPKTALSVGLKVDADALPANLVAQIKAGKVDLDDPPPRSRC